MKQKILLSLLFLVAAFFVVTCQRIDANLDDAQEENISLNEKSFSSNFDWQTTKIISLNITSETPKVIMVSSIENDVRYYKGMHTGGAVQEMVKISVPSHIEKLKVNNQEFNLSSNNINISL